LKNTGYGWCTDSRGAGQCVEGSAEGPYNQEKYDCMPGEGRTDPSSFGEVPPNTYVYGQTNPYIGPGSGNTYKHVLVKKIIASLFCTSSIVRLKDVSFLKWVAVLQKKSKCQRLNLLYLSGLQTSFNLVVVLNQLISQISLQSYHPAVLGFQTG